MIKADQPIKDYTEDKLNRASFAKNVAEAIIHYSSSTSFCMGLYGEWGSGKTSLLNMIIEGIEEIAQDVVVVRFNPWLCSDSRQLVTQFFKQLAAAMKIKAKGKDTLYKIIDKYGEWFGITTAIPLLGSAFAAAGKALHDQATQHTEEHDNNLQAQKEEIIKRLVDSKTKIVVSIDDIDRLSEKEIISVFQLVKSMADFPDTFYLLAFDYDVVIKALGKVQNGDGKAYLEKIVQIPIEIPAPNMQSIHNTLFEYLNQIIGSIPEKKFDKAEWSELFLYGISKYITSIRDAIRYANVLSLKYHLLKDEVDVVDLLGITCLQVFEPYIYSRIPFYSDTLCGSLSPYSLQQRHSEEKEAKEKIEQLFSEGIQVSNTEAARNIIALLFPKAGSVMQNHFLSYSYDHRKCLAFNKVASSRCFMRYFSLSLESGDIPSGVIRRLLTEADENEIEEIIERYNSSGEIVQLLEKMDASIYDKSLTDYKTLNIEKLIAGIMSLWPVLEAPNNGFVIYPLDRKIQDCITGLLFLIDEQLRFPYIQALFKNTKIQVSSLARLLERFESQHGRFFEDKKEEEKKSVTIDQLSELEQILKKRAIEAIEDGSAIKQKHGLGFLWILGKIDEEYVSDIKTKLVTDDASLAQIICYCSSIGRFASRTVHNTRSVNTDRLSEFIDVEEAYQRMKKYVMLPAFLDCSEDIMFSVVAFILQYETKVAKENEDFGIIEERIIQEIKKIQNERHGLDD